MLEQIKAWLDTTEPQPTTPCKEVAISTLLGEVMLADGHVSANERQLAEKLLARLTKQTPERVQELISHTKAQQTDAVSLFKYTSELKNLPIGEREDILYALWRLAFSDHTLDIEEEALIREVAELLYIPHGRFTWLKAQAQESNQT